MSGFDERERFPVASDMGMTLSVFERMRAAEVTLDGIKKDVQDIKESLLGNGQPGMKTRLDRLEQIEVRRKWTVRAILVAMLGSLVKYLVG